MTVSDKTPSQIYRSDCVRRLSSTYFTTVRDTIVSAIMSRVATRTEQVQFIRLHFTVLIFKMPKVTIPRTDRLRGYASEFGVFSTDLIENHFDRPFSTAYTSGK